MNETTFPFSVLDANGMVLMSGVTGDLPPHDGARVVREIAPSMQHYRDGDAWVKMPDRPSPHHVFNWKLKAWERHMELDDARAAKCKEIEAERDQRIESPIEHEGSTLDADARAQDNIKNKLAELGARIELGIEAEKQLLLWRTADNQHISFDTVAQMRAWLLRLTIAISQRGTQAYAWSWAMKEMANAASTVEELDLITW